MAERGSGAAAGRGLVLSFLVLALVLGAAYGFLVHRDHLFPYDLMRRIAGRGPTSPVPEDAPPGRWRRETPRPDEAEHAESWRRLEALGYLGTGAEAGDEGSGVTVVEPGRVMPGLNLYSSGHAPAAFLIDRDGRLVHQWKLEFSQAFPDLELDPGDFRSEFWRKVRLLPQDGDLLAIFEGLGLVRLDRDSRLVWALANASHHDLDVRGDSIYVLTRTPRLDPEIDPRSPILEDFVVTLDGAGEEHGRCSLLDAVRGSRYSALMDFVDGAGDLFHTNTLELLDARTAVGDLAAGATAALVSFPKLNSVGIVDLDRCDLVWALTGAFRFQHDPRWLSDGSILLFDNLGPDGRSRVLEIAARTQAVEWSYGEGEGEGFFSRCCGTAQRLTNGNTLITASEAGRAFEVDRLGSLVWEFRTPHRGGEEGELIATLNEVERVPLEAVAAWLDLGEPVSTESVAGVSE